MSCQSRRYDTERAYAKERECECGWGGWGGWGGCGVIDMARVSIQVQSVMSHSDES